MDDRVQRTPVMPVDAANLIWIDLEMTGLDPEFDLIIEIATLITDSELRVLAEGPALAISQPERALADMDEWNKTQHTASGLVNRVRESTLREADAERMTLAFVQEWVPAGASPMCGNSICQDRRFLHRCMPELERHFHYRHLDVSTVKELCQRWAPRLAYTKQTSHRALQDIRDSIDELKYYRQHFIRPA